MKVTYLLIACSLLMSACGSGPDSSQSEIQVDPELYQYALEFESSVGVDTSGISMRFEDLEGRSMGMCRTWDDGRREIAIDKEYWDKYDEEAREQLMYHEFGHCAMNLKHDAESVLDPNTQINIEASVMNPYFFGNKYNWRDYKASYKQALKDGVRLSF